jgi:hypothetical protein
VADNRSSLFPDPDSSHTDGESWPPVHSRVRQVLAPVERFLQIEAASGIVFILACIAAIVWANSSANGVYSGLWHTPIGFRIGPHGFERDLQFWINDGLMTIFFFLVGLEIRREIHAGAPSTVRRAALPLAAARGGNDRRARRSPVRRPGLAACRHRRNGRRHRLHHVAVHRATGVSSRPIAGNRQISRAVRFCDGRRSDACEGLRVLGKVSAQTPNGAEN